ncbi:hypothetical protein V6N11_044663 [Hibiscus sabdariffa]|uniref:Uncharacterized protein n=1 Tax=Hibiscus sabdariffa TaxID=183260 RepID=A0ABR2AA66_9ROSI
MIVISKWTFLIMQGDVCVISFLKREVLILDEFHGTPDDKHS